MTTFKTYAEAAAALGPGTRCCSGRHAAARKVAGDTWLVRVDKDTLGLVLCETTVVLYHRRGGFTLNSGGRLTRTVRNKIHAYSKVRLRSARGVWHVGNRLFRDGMRVW